MIGPPGPRPSADRVFFPWDRPLLPQVAPILAQTYLRPDRGRIDLTAVILVLPGARAGRRLLELLVEEAERYNLPLQPPRAIVTPGALPELLYAPELPLASSSVSRQAWARSLARCPAKELGRVFPLLPERGDAVRWVKLARVLEDLARTVGAGGWTFEEVSQQCGEGLLFSDHDRWTVLSTVQTLYREELESVGQQDRDDARREALGRQLPTPSGEVVLVGVADLPGIVREFLSVGGLKVTAMVHAPEAETPAFDEFGCVREEVWSERELPMSDETLAFGDRPQDQAGEVMGALLELCETHAPDEITVGVPPDGSVTPFLEQRLSAYGIAHRVAEGSPLRGSSPFRLLGAVSDYLGNGRFHSLADLLRHPDLSPSLIGPEAPDLADAYFRRRLPLNSPSARQTGTPAASGGPQPGRPVGGLQDLVDRLEEDSCLGRFREKRRLSAWMPEILSFLRDAFGAGDSRDPVRVDRKTLEASRRIGEKAGELSRLPERFDMEVEGFAAIRILLDEIKDDAIPPPAAEAALELVGWLEVHLDDAPNLVLTGLNDPALPQAVNAHPFLPNRLRQRLGLENNDSRYARDAYRMMAILKSKEWVRLVVGRRDTSGDPIRPSRLLFTGPPQEAATRIQRFTTPGTHKRLSVEVPPLALHAGPVTGLSLPPEPDLALPKVPQPFPVTWFRAYLENPYLWTLERVLGLVEVDDQEQELDGGAFGDLAHRVLDAFGRSAELHTENLASVTHRLSVLLDREAYKRHGRDPLPAVSLQIEQLRTRLEAFARWHVLHLQDGWRVAATEAGTPEGGVGFEVDGAPFFLSGRIDRIDHHAERGEWMVLDYKTGDSDSDPERAHRRRSGWKDLQLPLYRHLLAHLEEPLNGYRSAHPVRLGYLWLSKGKGPIKESLARWGEEELAAADDVARDIVRRLRSGGAVSYDPALRVQGREGSLELLLGKWTLVPFQSSDGEVE